ncbi:MAG: hypothetical protein JOY64_35190 [Alphaproteobacteria bacterium]|nr:hypothetical protein [Alphaproteobacteria bacterium]MBV8412913.1 hypothetical protein [Alphaproteobacteria bacterium]
MSLWSKSQVTLSIAAGMVLATLPAAAQSVWHLITPDEEARDDVAPHAPALPDRFGPPTIDLLRPDLSRPIHNPTTIELRFSPGPGATIDMASFSATYGWLGIDVTRRLLQHAVTTGNGLIARDVDLPLGNHRITLSIADTTGRASSRTFSLSVAR